MEELLQFPLPAAQVEALLALPHPQMRIVLYYCFAEEHPDYSAVAESGKQISERLGMNRSLYARTIRSLVDDGWITPVEKIGNITYYSKGPRLSPQAPSNVTALRRRSA